MSTIILQPHKHRYWRSFAHYIQYLFWCTSEIINEPKYKYIIINADDIVEDLIYLKGNKIEDNNFENGRLHKNRYILMYLKKISDLFDVIIDNKFDNNDIYKRNTYSYPKIEGYFILNNEIKQTNLINWFSYYNSEEMRNKFILDNYDNIKIGIVNRLPKSGRFLNNCSDLCDVLKNKFNIKPDVTYFEDKSFDYQIKFFNNHKIIISPHGAQLINIPFCQDNALIIECCHKEWHPYNYYPGLSHSSNKYHVMICDDHSYFPSHVDRTMEQVKLAKKKRIKIGNNKLNIKVNIDKVIDIINTYLKNEKLESHNIYLV